MGDDQDKQSENAENLKTPKEDKKGSDPSEGATPGHVPHEGG